MSENNFNFNKIKIIRSKKDMLPPYKTYEYIDDPEKFVIKGVIFSPDSNWKGYYKDPANHVYLDYDTKKLIDKNLIEEVTLEEVKLEKSDIKENKCLISRFVNWFIGIKVM